MVTEVGDTLTAALSVLDNVTVTAVGAAPGRLTAKGAEAPRATVVLLGTLIAPALWTVTFTVASGTLGDALACTTVEPPATPVTPTTTLLEFAGNVADAGTVATPVSSELNDTVKATGVTADRFNVTFCVAVPLMVTSGGVKLSVAVTLTA
jgi:hypothetical protein